MTFGNFQIKKSTLLIVIFVILITLIITGYSFISSDVSLNNNINVKKFQPTVLYSVMKKNATIDNTSSTYVSTDTGINFNNPASSTNGQGIYLKAETKNDLFPIYYYRGDITNNNVVFNNFCWKIVRTTNTGGVKMIYNGVPTDQDGEKICNNTGSASVVKEGQAFNESGNSVAIIGYKYGTPFELKSDEAPTAKYSSSVTYDATTKQYTLDTSNLSDKVTYNYHYSCGNDSTKCSEVKYYFEQRTTTYYYITLKDGVTSGEQAYEMMLQSDEDSVIKDYIENDWYENNMKNVTGKLEDTIYCNGRDSSNSSDHGFNSDGILMQVNYNHGFSSKFTLECPLSNDRFTTSKNNGNGKLKYPVGLIDNDEVKLAGLTYGGMDLNNYLSNTVPYWTMSPMTYSGLDVLTIVVISGRTHALNPTKEIGAVRPVVSLKMGTRYIKGNGEPDSPYIIE